MKQKDTFRKYNPNELDKLHKDMIFVLEKLNQLCQKYEISYFAVAGTLLGAIRHKGYIPWDDDLDVGMLIEDYDKFLNIPAEEFEEFGLYALEKNPGDYYSFVTKFYFKDSRFISPIAKADGKNKMGIFIEIFPFYDLPSNNAKIFSMYNKAELLKALYTTVVCDNVIVFTKGIKGIIKKAIKHILRIGLRLCNLDAVKISKLYDKMTRQYTNKDSEYVGSFSDVFSMYRKEWLSDTVRVKFENTTILIPKGYKGYLKTFYGDSYMQLPPESKRWNQAADYIRFIDGTEMKG